MVTAVASYLRDFDLKSASVFLLGALLLCPIAALAVLALGDSEGIWPHLLSTVLGRYLANTAGLMVGVACLSLFFGVGAAWIVSRYQLGLSRWFDVVMLLPMACPAYLVAYAYTDVFEYAGPIQGALRQLMGWKTAQDYYFPEIRSMGGAIFVLSSVLYPYIYLLARTAFQKIPASFYEVAALSDRNVFWGVCLPLARPAIVAGLALVLMEVVSDFGTVEYFAVQTLTLGIFNLWIG
ncbi:MAG: ABC transporter permease, partial [Paracoccaceae bacterium]